MKAGEIATRTGQLKRHQAIVNDLKGLGVKYNKLCAQAIVKNITPKQNKEEYLSMYKENIVEFFEKEILITPSLLNESNISEYKKALDNVKQFPPQFRPDNMFETKILEQTNKGRDTRRILLDGVIEKDNRIMQDYDKMIAYYLLMGGDKPVERFSKVEMSMKQYGIKPDLGVAIMKYGDRLTSKLEELNANGRKSPQEWEIIKGQVLHGFNVAEAIGNRNVNTQEHEIWEDRLVKLGILERRLEKNPEEQTLRESIKIDNNDDKTNGEKGESKVPLDIALDRNAQAVYERTGALPIGYKVNENGKVSRILPKVDINQSKDRLSIEGKLSATKEETNGKRENLEEVGER